MVTQNDEDLFAKLVDEVCSAWENTTWRGSERKMKHRAQKSPKLETALFLTLFWMVHYHALPLIGSLFDIHPRTLMQILKRMTVILNQMLKDEVKWPTDEELDSLTDGLLQNEGFSDAVCVWMGQSSAYLYPLTPLSNRKLEWEKEAKFIKCYVHYQIRLGNHLLLTSSCWCT